MQAQHTALRISLEDSDNPDVSQKLWSVKNQTTGEARENIPQADFIRWASGLESIEVDQWLVRSSDSEQWNPLTALTSFRLRRFGLPVIPSELAFTHQQLDWLEKSLSGTQSRENLVTVPPQFFRERRAHERFRVRLQVVVVSEENAFRTFTRDVSLGGLALEKAIPRNLTGSMCTIFISDPSSHRKISFSGMVIQEAGSSSGTKHRIRFEKMDAKAAEDLSNYIQIALAENSKAA